MKSTIERWKKKAKQLQREIHALYLVSKHARVPWLVKALAIFVVGYALSPIDLIPDFIPVLGVIDDLVIIPLGVYIILKLIPDSIMQECRQNAKIIEAKKAGMIVGVIVGLRYAMSITAIYFIQHWVRHRPT